MTIKIDASRVYKVYPISKTETQNKHNPYQPQENRLCKPYKDIQELGKKGGLINVYV